MTTQSPCLHVCTHTHCHSLTHSPSLTHTLTVASSHTHRHSLTHSPSLPHTLTVTHSHTHRRFLTHSLTHSPSLPHTLTITPSHTDIEVPPAATPQVTYSKPMPLPTYAQSEKYETEGVLDFRRKDTDGEDTEDEAPRRVAVTGTWCEFMLFFLGKFMCTDTCTYMYTYLYLS